MSFGLQSFDQAQLLFGGDPGEDAGLVDEVSVVGSRMLRRHGPLRWGVYGYFLLLHVWFFVVWRDWG